VEGLDQALKDGSYPNGLKNGLYPPEVHSIIGVKEVGADMETRQFLLGQALIGKEDGEVTIKNASASDRAQLCGGKELGKERE
jgi:hypothetical protein